MTRVQDMKRLAEEIGNAHEERRLFGVMLEKERREMKKKTAGFMEGLADDRREMTQALQEGLGHFKEEMAAGENNRRKEAAASWGQRRQEIHQRKAAVVQAQKTTRDLLNGFDEMHGKMKGALKKEMQLMRSAISDFMAQFMEETTEARERRGGERAACREEIRENRLATRAFLKEVQGRLREIEAACRERCDAVRAELAEFMSELSDVEQRREAGAREEAKTRIEKINAIRGQATNLRKELQRFLAEVDKGQKQAGDALRGLLSEYTAGIRGAEKARKEGVGAFLAELQTENRDVAAAWRGLLSAMGAGQGNEVRDEEVAEDSGRPDIPLSTADEVIEETPQPETQARTEFDPEQLKPMIVGVLNEAPDGLKMAQIADTLHIEQWRKLIPVMRDMQDSGQVRKEGPFYYSE